ncbi:ABC transporter substrate-binding protein [Pseudonocardia kongjuensis]|uniref:ABC transporter substrate-binding protein n=2 Tax=Pseudonocardia kongjuensis TaxID=102227 RepID=A0ABN1XGK2_9PSEU
MRIGRRAGTLLAASVCLFMIAACGGGESRADGGQLRVASNSNATALPFWIAQDQGLFEKHGLDVDYTKIENVATLPQALGTTFDIVLSTPTLAIASTAQGIPMSEVSGSSVDVPDNPSGFLMVPEGSGVSDVGQLAGARIGVLNETGTLHIATRNWLQQSGVDLDSLEIVQVDGPAQADQLRSGRIDAVETVIPFNEQIEEAGGISLGSPFQSLAEEITPIYWAARTDWAEQNRPVIERFRAALDEAQQFIVDNDAAARSVLQDELGYPDDVIANLELPTFDTAVRPQDVEPWLEAMRSTTGFAGDVDVDRLVVGAP